MEQFYLWLSALHTHPQCPYFLQHARRLGYSIPLNVNFCILSSIISLFAIKCSNDSSVLHLIYTFLKDTLLHSNHKPHSILPTFHSFYFGIQIHFFFVTIFFLWNDPEALFYTTSSRGSGYGHWRHEHHTFCSIQQHFDILFPYTNIFFLVHPHCFFYKMFYSLFPGAMNPHALARTLVSLIPYLSTLSKETYFFPFIKNSSFCAVPFFWYYLFPEFSPFSVDSWHATFHMRNIFSNVSGKEAFGSIGSTSYNFGVQVYARQHSVKLLYSFPRNSKALFSLDLI